jgi:hypothetical protein
MEQNILELTFDNAAFSSSQKQVLKGLDEVIKAAEKIEKTKISIGADASFKQLNAQIAAQTKQIQALQAANVKYIKSQEALTKADTAVIKQMQEEEKLLQQEIKTKKLATAETNKAAAAKRAESKALDELSNDYIQLNKAYNDAALKAKNYYITLGAAHPVTVQAIADAQSMRTALYAAEQAVGQSQRNVGNYASGWSSFNHVLRETPNFAISATTGIQALSNNIPMFADEIKKARTEGKNWSVILKELGANMFSFGGIATLVTIALTALPNLLSAMTSNTEKAAKKAKTFNEVKTESIKATITEKTELNALLLVARDETKSKEERSAAVKAINDIMPDYIGDLTLEKINTKETTDQINAYVLQLGKKALAQAYVSKIQEKYTQLIDIENSSIEDNVEWYNILWNNLKTGGNPSLMMIENLKSGVKNRMESVKSIKLEVAELQKKFDADLKSGKAVLDLDKQEKNTKEAKAKVAKQSKEDEGKFIFEMNKNILESEIKTLEYIAREQENSVSIRVTAYQQLYEKQNQLLKLSTDNELKNAKSQSERLKIQSENGIKAAEIEFNTLVAIRDIQREHAKKVQEDQKKAALDKEKAIEDELSMFAQRMSDRTLRDEEQLNNALIDLNQRYINGEISSHEEYEKQKLKISEEYSKKTLENQLFALKESLKIKGLSLVKQQEIATQIARIEKQLLDQGATDLKEAESEKDSIRQMERNKEIELARETYDLIRTLFTSNYDEERNRIQELIDISEQRYNREAQNIRNSTLSEEQKANRLKILENEQQTRRLEFDRKIRENNIKKAKQDRIFQAGQIIGNTALAVVGALAPPPIGLGPLLGLPLAKITGAIGAVQLATLLATPIPSYAKGTDNHPGGFARYGEAGPEKVEEPGKPSYIVDQETIGYLPKGTKVTPLNPYDAYMAMTSGAERMQEAVSNPSYFYDSGWDIAKWQMKNTEKLMNKIAKRPIRNTVVIKEGLNVNKVFGRA